MPRGKPGKVYDANARRRERYAADPAYRAKILASCSGYFGKNKERRTVAAKKYYRENVINFWEARIKKNYGLTKEQYDALLEKQNGVCAICCGPQVNKRKRLDVDHDHKTGKIRGLLCGHCNRAVGMLQDSPKLAMKAATYLMSAQEEVILALKAVQSAS